ncbi:hypothetical protein HY468_02550 [Candidatus Roizmanbacteria bacterium]|nr:hypothetical protein [Candidatus Roizmanbacteria bacterium]
MNKFAVLFLILFFLVVIGIGVLAVREELFSPGKAGQLCPVPQIPQNITCPEGQKMQLIKNNADGCYSFECR